MPNARRNAPTKVCAKCGRTVHVALKVCKCGNEFTFKVPIPGKFRAKLTDEQRKAAIEALNNLCAKRPAATNGTVSMDALMVAKLLVEKAGSIEAAKSALNALGSLLN